MTRLKSACGTGKVSRRKKKMDLKILQWEEETNDFIESNKCWITACFGVWHDLGFFEYLNFSVMKVIFAMSQRILYKSESF